MASRVSARVVTYVLTRRVLTGFARLPLDIPMLVISELLPKVQNLQASLNATTANSAIIDMLRSANLEHVLPKAPPLTPRKFQVSTLCLFRGMFDEIDYPSSPL